MSLTEAAQVPGVTSGRARHLVVAPEATQPAPAVTLGAQQRESVVENLNYIALGICLIVSNLWFFSSVAQFT